MNEKATLLQEIMKERISLPYGMTRDLIREFVDGLEEYFEIHDEEGLEDMLLYLGLDDDDMDQAIESAIEQFIETIQFDKRLLPQSMDRMHRTFDRIDRALNRELNA